VLEKAVPFEMELSVIAVRGADGAMAFYDVPRNTHRNGVLHESIVPASVPDDIRGRAEDYARRIAEALDYVGVIAVEMFLVGKDGGGPDLLVNEIAPRVHNSGHWTAEACAVSQFENHIRAVAGWPLGATARHADARMVNLLGDEVDDAMRLIRENPARSLHLYGKRDARPGRKMGHYVELKPLRRS
jgi:5-(carboxyamino)imidazole ribonucleotide synthase